jgi:hypothetical protein
VRVGVPEVEGPVKFEEARALEESGEGVDVRRAVEVDAWMGAVSAAGFGIDGQDEGGG